MTKMGFIDTVRLKTDAEKFKTHCGDSVVTNAKLALVDARWHEMSAVLHRLAAGVSAVLVDVE